MHREMNEWYVQFLFSLHKGGQQKEYFKVKTVPITGTSNKLDTKEL